MRVLDTDVCVAILRGADGVVEERARVRDEIVTTWMTAAELMYGAARSRDPAGNRRLAAGFLSTLTILDMDAAAAERFGSLKFALETEGRRLADADLIIASIALALGAILVTGNLRHFERVPGLTCESWPRPGGRQS